MGTAIYFAVDFDAQDFDMATIRSYLDGVRKSLGTYKVGIYGGKRTLGNVVAGRVFKAIAVHGETYVLWTALVELGTSHTYKGNGLMTVNNKDVQGVVCEGITYLPWECLADGVKSIKDEWVFTK